MKKSISSKTNSIRRIPNSHFIFLAVGCLLIVSSVISFSYVLKGPERPSDHTSLGIRTVGPKSAKLTAFVGAFQFSLRGFTSPGAHVILEGLGIRDETYADENGEFIFLNRFSPLSPREACLTAIDTNGRITQPVCLPPFSITKDVFIGPILLPPTVSANEDTYLVDDFGILTGKGAPESVVKIDLYSDTQAEKISLETKTNISGDYSLTLPTEHPKTMRAFSLNYFKDLISDKSLTLTMNILPVWKLILRRLTALFGLLGRYSIPIILLLEGLVLLWLFIWAHRKKGHPLALRPDNTLGEPIERSLAEKEDHDLVKQTL